MTKISFVGAGSTVFAKNLMGDILSYPELAGATISLHDIDEERLRTSELVGHKIAAALGIKKLAVAQCHVGLCRQAKRLGDLHVRDVQVLRLDGGHG